MKIIHTADLHLDSSLSTHLSGTKAKERKKELLYSFERMINFAKNNDVKVIIIAGDMFDKKHIAITNKKKVFDLISDAKNIDFLYLTGNHDEEILDENEVPKNLKLFNYVWNTYSYENVDISGINLTKETNKYLYDTLMLDQSKVNIVTMHGQIAHHRSNEDISLPLLKDKGIDYLALGHIHQYQCEKLDDRGVYCYCGCLESRGFDEVGEKGFVLLEVKGNKITNTFIKNSLRSMYCYQVDISDVTSWPTLKNKVNEKISHITSKDMVKIELVGSFKLNQEKYIEELENYLLDKFYFAKVKDLSRLYIDPSEYENEKSLKGEFIKEVKNTRLSEQLQNDIILCGIKALAGEEI